MIAGRLRSGKRIGIVSPSNPVTADLEQQLEDGIELLGHMGFQVTVGPHVRSSTLGYAATPEEKAQDINAMFADATVDAIFCSQGGATANSCLSHLDWKTIAANPKVFLGVSDITVLLNALYVKTGLITFHGTDVLWGFGRSSEEYEQKEFAARLVEGEVGPIPVNGKRRAIRSGVAEGVLLGGNLNCLLKLAGTEYFPKFAGAILFIEAINIAPEVCDHMLHQLKHIGVFDQIRGALVGYIDGLENRPEAPQMEDILLRVASEHDFPILKVAEFGHNCANTILPVGATVRMDAAALTYEIVSPFVA